MKLPLTLLAVSVYVAGHDLYLKPEAFRLASGTKSTVAFHNGDDFPNSAAAPTLARLREVNVVTAAGKQPMTNLRQQDKIALADFTAPSDAAFLLTTHTIPNFIELQPKEFEDYLKHEHLDTVVEWRAKNSESAKPGRERYSKYVKSILHTGVPDASVTKPVGFPVEFVPLVDPASLKKGQRLRVRVLLRGQPLAGTHVEAQSFFEGKVKERQLGRTNAAGEMEIPLDTPGFWKLHTIRMERLTGDQEADWESLWASLTFEVNR
jgi:uncharacterized GH25 family protein